MQNSQHERQIPEHWTFDPDDYQESWCAAERGDYYRAELAWDPSGDEDAPHPLEVKETMRVPELGDARLCAEHLPEYRREMFDRVWGSYNRTSAWLDQRAEGEQTWSLDADDWTWIESGAFDVALENIREHDIRTYGQPYGITEWYTRRQEERQAEIQAAEEEHRQGFTRDGRLPEHWAFNPEHFTERPCDLEYSDYLKARAEWDPSSSLEPPQPPPDKRTMCVDIGDSWDVPLCEEHLPEKERERFHSVWDARAQAEAIAAGEITCDNPSPEVRTWLEHLAPERQLVEQETTLDAREVEIPLPDQVPDHPLKEQFQAAYEEERQRIADEDAAREQRLPNRVRRAFGRVVERIAPPDPELKELSERVDEVLADAKDSLARARAFDRISEAHADVLAQDAVERHLRREQQEVSRDVFEL